MTAPLTGIRVLDFTRVLAGPHCTKMLRDLGADITKIEPPGGDAGRGGVPHINQMSVYYAQQNAGKRNLCIDLNWLEAREIVTDLARDVDIVIENFRPGTLKRFGLDYDSVRAINPNVIYVSMSGYGQTGPWRNRPAFAPTVQAETGHTAIQMDHFGAALAKPMTDSGSHADVYTGLQGCIATLAALQQRERTGQGQHVDVAMAATMLSVNERAGALLSGVDTAGEPMALSAPDSHIFEMSDGRLITIAASPIYTPMFARYAAMMRRNDLLSDPRFASAPLRRENLDALLAEIRAWILTFTDLDQLQTQVSESNLAIGVVRTTQDLAESEWAEDWGAVVQVDDRGGDTLSMPGAPWRFSGAELPEPGKPSFQGEDNAEILSAQGMTTEQIDDLRARKIILSRRAPAGAFDDF